MNKDPRAERLLILNTLEVSLMQSGVIKNIDSRPCVATDQLWEYLISLILKRSPL